MEIGTSVAFIRIHFKIQTKHLLFLNILLIKLIPKEDVEN